MSPMVIQTAAGRRLSRGSTLVIVTLGSWLLPLLAVRLVMYFWELLS